MPSIIHHISVNRHQRGVAATELALLLPLLMVLAIAACDLGRIMHFDQVVANAARTGAAHGASERFSTLTRAAWQSRIETVVTEAMQRLPDFAAADLQIEVNTELDASGDTLVSVLVRYPFRTVISWPGLASEVLLNQRETFRQFR